MISPETAQAKVKYQALLVQITARQQFEASHPEEPYLSHPTTLDYTDIHGYTLLQYAAQLGDATKIEACLTRGADVNFSAFGWAPKPMVLALNSGSLEAAKMLHAKGADCSAIPVSACGSPETQKWFTHEIQNVSNLSLSRAVELGNINKLRNSLYSPSIELTQALLDGLLVTAAEHGHYLIVDFLCKRKVQINPAGTWGKSALHQSVLQGHHNITCYLLKNGANVNQQDHAKRTTLMRAIEVGDVQTIALLLRYSPDVTLHDVHGNSMLHYAARSANPDVLALCMNFPEASTLLAESNIYGYAPIDVALQEKNDIALRMFLPDKDINALKVLPAYGKQPVKIRQAELTRQWRYYLTSQYRDTNFLSVSGHCNGLSFLSELYADQGKQDYFYSALEKMLAWDGSEEGLSVSLEGTAQENDDETLREVFEQWINDVIFFHHATLGDLVNTLQSSRTEQLALLSNDDQHHILLFEHFGNNSVAEIQEIVMYMQRTPAGTRYEMNAAGHATSWHTAEKAQAYYYDPNFFHRTTACKDSIELSRRIVDFQLVATQQMQNETDRVALGLTMYCYDAALRYMDFDSFEVFLRHELPQSKEDASLYREHSANKFTHLHVAVMTHSISSLKKLIADGYCDLNAKNKNGETALSVALDNKFYPAAEALMNAMLNLGEVQSYQLLFYAIERGELNIIKNLATKKTWDWNKNQDGHTPLGLALKSDNLAIVEYLLEKGADASASLNKAIDDFSEHALLLCAHVKDVNACGTDGDTPMHVAFRHGNVAVVQALLARGARLDVRNTAHQTLFDIIKNVLPIEMRGPNNAHETLLVLLMPQLTPEDLSRILFDSVGSHDTVFSKALSQCDTATLNMRAIGGSTILHKAIVKKQYHNIVLLLNTDIDINAETDRGNTPLKGLLLIPDFDPARRRAFVSTLLKKGATVDADTLALVEKLEDSGIKAMIDAHQQNQMTVRHDNRPI